MNTETPDSGHDRLRATLARASRRAESIPDSHRILRKHNAPPTPDPDEERYGFRWGPLVVERLATFPRRNGEDHVLAVKTDAGKQIDIYVSPTGRSLRVFSGDKEWKP